MKNKPKRTHPGRIAVLLDREATPAVRELAKADGRSLNSMASRAVLECFTLRSSVRIKAAGQHGVQSSSAQLP